ncbi:MAG: 3-deoxy-manno-octulosonate cytidylyltransferase [Gammaproteobacteria bacterium]|nr:3-deoxy-manno-octulosonate cytidylyltransferase [Gammaproteobacteria bacterium]
MNFSVLIPARFDSTRLPGKPLAEAGGRPLIQWVFEAACRSAAERIVIVTDDERVLEAANSFGAEACLTDKHHASGTDRVAEAARQLDIEPEGIIVNLQGDEPRMPGDLIDKVARTLADSPDACIATAAHVIEEEEELNNPNIVKVVCARNGNALYFSRSRLPYPRRAPADSAVYRHLGIYAYRHKYLRRYTSREPSVLERTECLEQLRALEYGDAIAVHRSTCARPAGIDTPDDLQRFRREIAHA